jgi:dipeptidyl aminopeptidase/acylaminoacyl peptidase
LTPAGLPIGGLSLNFELCILNLLLHFGPGGFVADSPVQAFAVSPDGRRIACARDGNWFDIYDPAGNHVTSGRASDPDQIQVLAFSPDGKTLAGGLDHSGTVWLWDAATGEQHLSVTASLSGVRSLAFSPDGKRLACGGSADAAVLVVDPAARVAVQRLGIGNPDHPTVSALGFDSSGRWLAAGAMMRDGQLGTASVCRVGGRPRVVHEFPIRRGLSMVGCPVAVHPSGRTTFVGDVDRVLAVETAGGATRYRTLKAPTIVTKLVADPAGRFVAGIGAYTRLLVWDADTGEMLADWRPPGGTCIEVVAAGGRLFTPGEKRTVIAWPWPAAPPRKVDRPTAADPTVLAGDDAAGAFAAIRRLSADPSAVELARGRLAPVSPPSAESVGRVRSLVRRLAGDDFDDRQAANRDLAALGPTAAPELRRALRAAADPEVADRLDKLLRDFETAEDAAEVVSARWLEVLERINTPDAVSLVRAVATGDPDHPRTEDAVDTLARMTGKRGQENRR